MNKNNFLPDKTGSFIKKLWLFAFFLFFSMGAIAQCPTGGIGVALYSQADVNNFATYYPNCTEITGSLFIGDIGDIGGSDITDLSPLSNIQSIGGLLEISYNSQLTNLDGLSNLTQIGGYLNISSNSQLANLDGLSNLTQIGGYLDISYNSQLTNLDGLSNLTSIGGYLGIYYNSNLTNLDGLSNLTSVGGYLYINSNSNLTNLDGLSNLTQIGVFLQIGYNSQLTNLDGLSNLTSVGGSLDIDSNSNLTNLDGLSNLTSIGGYLGIYSNSNLTNLDGLSNLTQIGEDLQIGYNSQLTNLDGLSNLTQIGGRLYIYNNSQLTNLDGLSNLTSIGGDLFIQFNSSLTDISGLQNIDPTSILSTYYGLGLYIVDNINLSVCNLPNFCTYLAGSGLRTISGNAGDCISEAAVTTACIPACDAPTNLTATNITSVSATLGWTSAGNNFDIEWGVAGFTPGSGTTVTDITTNSYDLTNLDYNTQYQFYVRQDCSVNESDWAGPFSFTTPPTCPDGDLYLFSQADIDAFASIYPNCTNISGNIIINGTDITGLTGLSAIESIGGMLYIYNNPQLESLNELNNLTTVGNGVSVFQNHLLEHLDGLNSLTTIGGALDINSNNNLTDISALENIDPFTITHLYIRENPNLSVCNLPNFCTYLQGLEPRTISGNAGDCISEAAVTTACIPACDAPTNLTATNITSVSAALGWTSAGNNFDIEWGTQGFTQGSGTTVTGITANSYNLTNLDYNTQYQFYVRQDCTVNESDWAGPFSFTTPPTCPDGDLYLFSQADIDAFASIYPNCTNISGNIIINGTDITGLTGLSAIESIGGMLYIYNNPQLESLNELNNLTTVGNGVSVFQNHLLEHLDGLNSLTTIGGALDINSNNNLTDISALENIDPFTITHLYIRENPNLSVCNLPNFCTYLQGLEPRTISGNAGDCISEAAVTAACFLSGSCDSYTIWNGSVWSNGAPDTTKRVIIEGDLTLTEDVTACEVLLNSGTLTVSSGATLTVNGVIENTQSATNFMVESGANLIQVDDVENVGEITVYRNSSLIKHLDYTLWSSPVAEQGLKEFSPQTIWYRIYDYNTTTDQWNQIFGTSSDPDQNFEQGIGYMFRAPNDFVTTPYTYNGEFTGVPNNGEVTVNFTTTGKYQGLGNPYPSSISTTDLQTETDLGTLYFWTNTNPWDDNQGNYTANNWATHNGVGGVAAANDTKEPNAFISTGQGFVADTEIAPNTYLSEVTFTNAMRTSNEGVFFKAMEEEKHRLWLNLSDEQQTLNQTLIGYVQGATQGLDYGIDAQMFGYSGSALYSLIDNNENNFVIQGRTLPFDDNDVVSLGFKADQAGSFTISLSDFDGIFAENQNIYLRDNSTQTEHNLKDGDYSFVSQQGTFNSRFEVVYKQSGALDITNPDLNNNWVVYKQNDVFHIYSRGFEMKEVTVYDVLGRVVYSDASEGNSHILPYLGANQILIVKITTNHDEVMSKKVGN